MKRKEKKDLLEGAYDDDEFYRRQHDKQDRDRFGRKSAEQARREMMDRQSCRDLETGYLKRKKGGGR